MDGERGMRGHRPRGMIWYGMERGVWMVMYGERGMDVNV